MIALDPRGFYDWVHPYDRELPAERQTTFRLNVLTLSEREWLAGAFLKDPTRATFLGLRLGIADIQNMPGPDGILIEAKFGPPPKDMRTARPQVLAEETLQIIPPEYIEALGEELGTGAYANEADRKKSR